MEQKKQIGKKINSSPNGLREMQENGEKGVAK